MTAFGLKWPPRNQFESSSTKLFSPVLGSVFRLNYDAVKMATLRDIMQDRALDIQNQKTLQLREGKTGTVPGTFTLTPRSSQTKIALRWAKTFPIEAKGMIDMLTFKQKAKTEK